MSDDYNFVFHLANQKVIAKGNVNSKSVPDGDFLLYRDNGNKYSEGKYENGIKSGAWKYFFQEGKNVSIVWNLKKSSNFRYALPSTFIQKEKDGFVTYNVEIDSDSLVETKFVFTLRDLHTNGVVNFDEFCKEYFKDLESDNMMVKADYSDEFKKRFDTHNLKFHQYLGRVSKEKKVSVFSALFLHPVLKDKVVELALVISSDRGELGYTYLTEILLDMHYDGKPIFNRFKLDYVLEE